MRAAPLSPTAAVLLPLASLALGCTGAVSSGAATGDADSAVTQALVLVERTVDTAEGTRAAASARFARVAAGVTPEDTLRAVGASLDLPAAGSCASIRPVDTAAGSADPVPVVELLDMGRVSVEAQGAVTALVPRQLPYVADVVTGTVYARAAEATVLPARADYILHVSGVGDVAGFDVTATAPSDASDVAIAQETTPSKVVTNGAAIDFSFTVGSPAPSGSAASGGPIETVYVELQPAGLRCTLGDGTLRDSAGGSADPVIHASVAASLLGDAGTLVVHRVHSEPLQGRGVDGGELRFDFARVVSYTR